MNSSIRKLNFILLVGLLACPTFLSASDILSELLAQQWYERLKDAENGDSEAQFLVGREYFEESGFFDVPEDKVIAAKWFRKSAEQGHAIAQNFLASMYSAGEGVPKSKVNARQWYRKSAIRGDPRSQMSLGFYYQTGIGGVQSELEASKWYRMAVDQGDVDAKFFLAQILLKEKTDKEKLAEAVTLLQQGAREGKEVSQIAMANMYFTGDVVQRNWSRGYSWLLIAAAQDSKVAADNIKLLETKLTPKQITEGQKIASICYESDLKDCD